jgi:threonine/homoserine/homoserine lactone efflux protein
VLLSYILQFFIGLAVGLYSYLSPGIINIQVFQLATHSAFRKVLFVLLVISLVEIPYCLLCMLGFKWIATITWFNNLLQWAIVLVLFFMAWFTYRQAMKNKKVPHDTAIVSAMSMKALLLFAIFNPFQLSAWSIWGAYFVEKKWFQWNLLGIGIFSMGACLGVFLILLSYALLGKKWIAFFSKHRWQIDLGIAGLLLLLGIIQLVKNLW